jgi:mannose-6-phosphate isomerase-like protein (cupin superfamily)
MKLVIAAACVVAGLQAKAVLAQTPSPSTSATDISNADFVAVMKSAPTAIDQQIKVVDLGKYAVAVGVLQRPRSVNAPGAILHSKVTEVYHIMEGSGTLVTGGTLPDATASPADGQVVQVLVGPSIGSRTIENGNSRKVGAGDVIVIPAGVPHWFSSVDADLKYLVIRVDAEHVLPAGYVHPAIAAHK